MVPSIGLQVSSRDLVFSLAHHQAADARQVLDVWGEKKPGRQHSSQAQGCASIRAATGGHISSALLAGGLFHCPLKETSGTAGEELSCQRRHQ